MFIIQGWGTDQRVWPQWLKDSGTCYSKNLPQFQVVEQEFLQCFSVKQKKLTAVMVTHNLRYAVEYGTRLVMMDRGNIILDKAGEDKKNTSIDDILAIFNKISIECGN